MDTQIINTAGKLYRAFWEAMGWTREDGTPMPPNLFDRPEGEIKAWVAVATEARIDFPQTGIQPFKP